MSPTARSNLEVPGRSRIQWTGEPCRGRRPLRFGIGTARIALGTFGAFVLGACSSADATRVPGGLAAGSQSQADTTGALDGVDAGSPDVPTGCAGDSGSNCGPVILASGRNSPTAIAVNAAGVYWTEANAITAVALTGGAPATIASGAYVSTPVGLALGSTGVYWSNGGGGPYAYSVMKAPLELSGGSTPSAFSIPNAEPQPWGIAVADGFVYWGDYDWNAVYKAAEAGGSASAIWIDQDQLPDNQPTLVAADSASVYFATAGGEVNQIPVGGGAAENIRPSKNDYWVAAIAIDSTNVYWIQATPGTPGGALVMEPRAGGPVTTLVPADPLLEGVIAVDSTGVYWDNGNLMKTPLDGGDAITLAVAQSATALAVDATHIYWTNSTAGTVTELAK
jgi:hypothetical protein